MKEQQPCVRQIVERIDAGNLDEATHSRIEQLTKFTRQFKNPERDFSFLHCLVADCPMVAGVIQAEQSDPRSLYVSMNSEEVSATPIRPSMCAPEMAPGGLPDMIDGNSCVSTTAVYGLRKLGLRYTTEEIDAMSGRLPNEPTDSFEHRSRLDDALMRSGVKITEIRPCDSVDDAAYWQPDSQLTYADYKRDHLSRVSDKDRALYENWFENEWTETVFEQSRVEARARLPFYDRCRQQGLLVMERQNITFELLTQQLAPGAYVECSLLTRQGTTHSVCIEDVKQVKNGWVIEYFNPGQPSTISKKRGRSFDDIIYANHGITVYSRPN